VSSGILRAEGGTIFVTTGDVQLLDDPLICIGAFSACDIRDLIMEAPARRYSPDGRWWSHCDLDWRKKNLGAEIDATFSSRAACALDSDLRGPPTTREALRDVLSEFRAAAAKSRLYGLHGAATQLEKDGGVYDPRANQRGQWPRLAN